MITWLSTQTGRGKNDAGLNGADYMFRVIYDKADVGGLYQCPIGTLDNGEQNQRAKGK